MKKGVFKAVKKDGTVYYRANITRSGRHISLGSYESEEEASQAYKDAQRLYSDHGITLLDVDRMKLILPFDKIVSIINHRDHGIYIKTPIYLQQGYFSYYLKGIGELKFDNDDLFYYSSHRILVHDGHLYVNDFGMQYGILTRFGIKNHAVAGRDYTFANGDDHDFRYQNIIIINRFHGVTRTDKSGIICHETRIHINGEFLIGRFPDDCMAATAYNKAADAAISAGIRKNFPQNYIPDYSAAKYADVYRSISLPSKYRNYLKDLKYRTRTSLPRWESPEGNKDIPSS